MTHGVCIEAYVLQRSALSVATSNSYMGTIPKHYVHVGSDTQTDLMI